MAIIVRQEQIDGRWFTWITTEGFNTMIVEDDHEITEEEAQIKLDNWKSSQIVIPEVTDGVTN